MQDHDNSREPSAASGPADPLIPAESFSSARLCFIPVLAAHATPMFDMLQDASLYRHTGGAPPATLEELEKWFAALESRCSPDGGQAWLTWIMRLAGEKQPIGYLQATVEGAQADIAWLVGSEWQGNGFATEGASALVAWLAERNVCRVSAHIRPGHTASCKVATAAGLEPAGIQEDGEDVWQLRTSGRQAP